MCRMTVAGNCAHGDQQNRRSGCKIDSWLRRTLGLPLQRQGAVGINIAEFRQCHSPAEEFGFDSVLSSFTAPALALAMCIRTAFVVSSTRVLGRWNLRVAVDTRRQRPYRLRRVCLAANTSSDLIALIAPVKDFEDYSKHFCHHTFCRAISLLRRRDGRTFRYGRCAGEGYQAEVGSIWGLLSTFLSSH